MGMETIGQVSIPYRSHSPINITSFPALCQNLGSHWFSSKKS